MNLFFYCYLWLIFVLKCGTGQSISEYTGLPGYRDVFYQDNDMLDAKINVIGIPNGVDNVMLYFGDKLESAKSVVKETKKTMTISKTLTTRDDGGTFYIKITQFKDIQCDMQPIIKVKKRNYTDNLRCLEDKCKLNLEVDFKNKCSKPGSSSSEKDIIKRKLKAEHKKRVVPVFSNIHVTYKIGQLLQVTCEAKDHRNIIWYAADGSSPENAVETIPECRRNKCNLHMNLEFFDNETILFCSSEGLVSDMLIFILIDAPSRAQQTSTEDIVYYSENEDLTFKCRGKHNIFISNSSQYGRVAYKKSVHRFRLNKKSHGLRLICTYYDTNEKPEFQSTRRIDNYKLYLSKDHTEESTGASTNWVLILAPIVGSGILLTAGVVLLFKYKKRISQPSHEVDTYACINRVEYADLDILQTNSRRNNIHTNDRTPYAQVIGVLTPKK